MAKATRLPKHKQRFSRTRSASGFIRRVSSKDLADIKILLRRVEQMLSMAKRMACSTLSTYVFDFHCLNTERPLLTRHECSKYLQEPDQTPQDLVKAHESSQPSSTEGKETIYHIGQEHSPGAGILLLDSENLVREPSCHS